MGGKAEYKALATFDDGRRQLFALARPNGIAILGEAWEQPIGAEVQPRMDFVTRTKDGEVSIRLIGSGWDAGSEQVLTEAPPFGDLPKAEANRRLDARRKEIALAKDQILITKASRAWEEIVGRVETALEEAGIQVAIRSE